MTILVGIVCLFDSVGNLFGQSPAIEVILTTTEEIDGLEGVHFEIPYSSLGPTTYTTAMVSESGHVVAKLEVEGTDVDDDHNDVIIYAKPGEEAHIILREGDALDSLSPLSPGMVVRNLFPPQVERSGKVAIHGTVGVPGEVSSERFLLMGEPPNLALIAYHGMDVGEATPLSFVSNFDLNQNGEFVIVGSTEAPEVITTLWKGVPDPGNVVVQSGVDTYEFLPEGDHFEGFGYLSLNNNGDILFHADLKTLSGIWLAPNGAGAANITKIALEGEPVPGADGFTFYRYNLNPYSRLGDGGFFASNLNIEPDGVPLPDSERALLIGDASKSEVVFRSGDEVAGVDEVKSLSPLQITPSGEVLLMGAESLFTLKGESFQRVVTQGEPVPAFSGLTFQTINRAVISPKGRVAFQAVDSSNFRKPGIWAEDSAGARLYAAGRDVQMELPGGAIVTLDGAWLLPDSFDSQGRFPALVSWQNERYYALVLIDPNKINQLSPGISGVVLEDLDFDGRFSRGDSGKDGITVQLFASDGQDPLPDTPVKETQTNDDGSFVFTEVESGNYVIALELPDPYRVVEDASAPIDDKQISITYEAGTISAGNDFLISDRLDFSITMHRLEADDIENVDEGNEGIDIPLIPKKDTSFLEFTPTVSEGLVADGVTPLLFAIEVQDPPEQAVQYQVTVEIESGGILENGDISGRVFSLQDSLANPVFDFYKTDSETLSRHYVWLQGIPSGDVVLDPGSRAINAVLKITRIEDDGQPKAEPDATLPFKIAKPPIIFVSTRLGSLKPWGADFLSTIGATRPEDFLVTSPKFARKSIEDSEFRSVLVEDPLAPIKNGWAVTRGDWVFHGAAGVLFQEFSRESEFTNEDTLEGSEKALFRGLWNRAVAVGVPNNGSTLAYYSALFKKALEKLDSDLASNADPSETKLLLRLEKIPDAFSVILGAIKEDTLEAVVPTNKYFQEELHKHAYSEARIHFVSTEVAVNNVAFQFMGLTPSRLQKIAPLGSDGLVDYDSAMGWSLSTRHSNPTSSFYSEASIANRIPDFFTELPGFNVPESQTTSTGLAKHILKRLDSSKNEGYFQSVAQAIDQIKPLTNGDLAPVELAAQTVIDRIVTLLKRTVNEGLSAQSSGTAQFNYSMPIPDDVTISGDVTWLVEVYGPDGVTTEGVTLETSGDFQEDVSVIVSEGVVGDVVLYGSFLTTEEKLVYGLPVVVTSIEPENATLDAIEVIPDSGNVLTGTDFSPQLFAIYSDGSRLRRALTAENFSVESSDPAVIDVSDGIPWRALSTGSATLSVTYQGVSTEAAFTVIDSLEPTTLSLAYELTESASLVLTWEDPGVDGQIILEQSDNFAPGSWTAVPVSEPGRHEVSLDSAGPQFFRLRVE